MCSPDSCIEIISIHAPIVGCDCNNHHVITAIMLFQSTHPSWGATQITLRMIQDVFDISIHAPIVGCDLETLALKEALPSISIHAPIVGCDITNIHEYSNYNIFQSTHPSWGATAKIAKFLLEFHYF